MCYYWFLICLIFASDNNLTKTVFFLFSDKVQIYALLKLNYFTSCNKLIMLLIIYEKKLSATFNKQIELKKNNPRRFT